jgi:hypothetical protein
MTDDRQIPALVDRSRGEFNVFEVGSSIISYIFAVRLMYSILNRSVERCYSPLPPGALRLKSPSFTSKTVPMSRASHTSMLHFTYLPRLLSLSLLC